MEVQSIKNRYGIIGSSTLLDRVVRVAMQVAPTDMSVLITGESGVGKEVFSKIIHQLSKRKHNNFIAVNCGAIPEGTIDSELFGHEKGAFTGATDSRKGYFEVVNGGTIFLDEVADLPAPTQARLLRVLESGEFIRVGSSKVQKTDVRVVAATNLNMQDTIYNEKFREDLYYRLNTVPIRIPPLRERSEDISLLFRKFAQDFSEKYRMPLIRLNQSAKEVLEHYRWPGNIRQLRNITEQVCVLETEREIDAETLQKYIPSDTGSNLPMVIDKNKENTGKNQFTDRELLYNFLFDMKKDIIDLKKLVMNIMQSEEPARLSESNTKLIKRLYSDYAPVNENNETQTILQQVEKQEENNTNTHEIEESLSLEDRELELITKALRKHRGKRKSAAKELGISERTLYRKIKEFNVKE